MNHRIIAMQMELHIRYIYMFIYICLYIYVYIYTVYIIVVFSIYLYNLIYAWWMPAIYCIGQESDLQKRLSFEICIVHHLYMDMWRIAIICIYKGVYIYVYIYIYTCIHTNHEPFKQWTCKPYWLWEAVYFPMSYLPTICRISKINLFAIHY